MIKLRQILAYHVSILLVLISFGIFKPNFSGKFDISDSTFHDNSEISLNFDKKARR